MFKLWERALKSSALIRSPGEGKGKCAKGLSGDGAGTAGAGGGRGCGGVATGVGGVAGAGGAGCGTATPVLPIRLAMFGCSSMLCNIVAGFATRSALLNN